MQDLSITLIQTKLFWEDIDANLAHFSKKIASITKPSHLIILPEMFSTGFSMNAAQFAEAMTGKAFRWMQEQAKKTDAVILGTLMIEDAGHYYNRLIWMRPDGSYEQYDKHHLFGLGAEDKTYTKGQKKLIVELDGWKICPMICYDLRFPVWSRNTLIDGEPAYDVLIYTANWPEKRTHHWNALLPARAVENQCYVIGLNRIGNDGNDIPHSGHSQIVGPDANYLYIGIDMDEVATTRLSAEDLALKRRQFPFLKDADDFQLVN